MMQRTIPSRGPPCPPNKNFLSVPFILSLPYALGGAFLGRIRPRFIKRAATEVVEKYRHDLSTDYEENREFLRDILEVPSQTVKNRIVGYVTTLMKKEERAKLA